MNIKLHRKDLGYYETFGSIELKIGKETEWLDGFLLIQLDQKFAHLSDIHKLTNICTQSDVIQMIRLMNVNLFNSYHK